MTGVANAEDASIKHMSFKITVPYKSDITVTSSNGKRWDTILPKTRTSSRWTSRSNTRYPGYVDRAGVYLGGCSKTGCGAIRDSSTGIRTVATGASTAISISTPVEIPVTTTAGIATTDVGDAMLNACNAKLQGEEAATEVISLGVPVTATLSVNTRKQVLAMWDDSGTEPSSRSCRTLRSMAATSARRPPSS